MRKSRKDYLDKLIRYANAPIIVWDPDLRITRFSGGFEKLTGWMEREIIGENLNRLFPKVGRDATLELIERARKGEHWEYVEIPILSKDGAVKVTLWNSANIYAEDGTTLVATIAQGMDITERKRAEEKIKQHADELERFNRMMVNREIRMIELKKQVNDLCIKAGQTPPYQLDFVEDSGAA
jgi:PAS domain S-box-containing protein